MPGQHHPNTPLHVRPVAIAAVAVGGVVGTSARYALDLFFPNQAGHWPMTTFAINIAGAFFLGWLLEGLTRAGSDSGWLQHARLLLGTGVTGSFTTYSSLAVETDQLLDSRHVLAGAAYLFASVLVGAAATIAGVALANTAHHRMTIDEPATVEESV